MPIRHARRRLALLAALAAVAATAGCTHPTPTASPSPPVTTTPATVLGPLTHPFGPRRALFTANVPDRFTDVAGGTAISYSAEATLPLHLRCLPDRLLAVAVRTMVGELLDCLARRVAREAAALGVPAGLDQAC